MKRVCILLNGKSEDYGIIKKILVQNEYDCIICADGGANHTYNMNIVPDYIIGDLDSVENNIVEHYKNLDVKFEKFPSRKDETDTELCIYLAQKLGAKEIDFYFALGGRIDHTIANINLLHFVRSIGILPKIISEKETIHIVINEEVEIEGNVGDTVSVIPINGDAKMVTLTNFEYPLDNYDMKFSLPLGISNVMLKNKCTVGTKDGSLLVIRNI